MDALTDAKSFVREAVQRMQMVQHHAPARAQILVNAVLLDLEKCLLTLEDVEKVIDRETEK